METADKFKINQRPPLITFICLFFGLFGGLVVFLLFFLSFIIPGIRDIMIREYGIIRFTITTLVPFTLGLVGLIGYWKMRKWGLYFYSAMFVFSILSSLILNTQISFLSIIIPLGVIGVGFTYFKQMT